MKPRSPKKTSQFVILWEFHVRLEKRRAFERAYASHGVWAEFFRLRKGYLRTELIRDRQDPLHYLTIDVWRSRKDYEKFKKDNRAEYQEIDKKCAMLTRSEKLLGEFTTIAGAVVSNAYNFNQRIAAGPFIRCAVPGDIPRMVALERDATSAAHWPEPTYHGVFSDRGPTRIALVTGSETGEKLFGFVIARWVEEDCELENIVVARKQQNRGLGSRLMQSLATEASNRNATRIFLEVRESNAAACALYEKCGFVITGRRTYYYTDPIEDAILYTLQL